ncbi:unnamed protein product [Paramecium pentaurelia]|uniref:Uncharacterized protein n=1 Tax=Paramecium pentaurelia TaxID=43138 RepID=A0A8S1S8D8_9CILI|nr:unnamed protein product [Paramecium pentaurelia]
MGTACSSEKIKISPTISTCDLINNDNPFFDITHAIIQNIELIGELETAPFIVQQYSKRLQIQCQPFKSILERLENDDQNQLKIWNLLVGTLKNFSGILKEALKNIHFIEYLPIISYNFQELQKDLDIYIGYKKGEIKRAQSNIIQSKIIRIQKRHQTDKI